MKPALLVLFLLGFVGPAYAQTTIQVPHTDPCFMNFTAGVQMWRNCGIDKDYLKTALLPWEYVTGGNFTLIFVSLVILATYIKYQKTIYPLLIGTFFIPLSVFMFPASWVNWAIILGGLSIGIMIWDAFIRQTKGTEF